MATSGPTNLPAFLSSDADFRAFVQGIHNALAGFADLTQTADTGQINPATVARPAAGAYGGYEIWRFNDALQATVPIFFKLEYGTGGAQDRPALAITVGTGSSGAGAITGGATRVVLGSTASKAAGVMLPFYASCEPGRLDLAANIDPTTATFGIVLHIERARDANGAATADGAVMASVGNGSGTVQVINPTAGVVSSNTARLLPYGSPTTFPGFTQVGADIAVATPAAFAGKPLYGQGVVAYNNADIPALATFVATVLGGQKTYLPLGLAAGLLTAGGGTGAAAIRFE